MKLIIDIPEEYLKTIKAISDETSSFDMLLIKYGTPFDSFIEDIKTEIFRQSKQTNESFSHDWNEGFNDGMFHVLTIIRENFKHISGKEN